MRAIDQSAIRNLTLFREMADDTYDRLMRGGYVQNFPPIDYHFSVYRLIDGSGRSAVDLRASSLRD